MDPSAVKVVSVSDAEPEKASPELPGFYSFLLEGASPNVRSNAGEVEVKVKVLVKCSY